jgi:hypothetical protein
MSVIVRPLAAPVTATLTVPGVPVVLGTTDVATPEALVTPMQTFCLRFELNATLGTTGRPGAFAGAVKKTSRPETGLPAASLICTTSGAA